MERFEQLVEALRHTDFGDTCDHCERWGMCKDDDCIILQAAAAIEALVNRVKCAEEKIKLYKGEADLYKDLYRSAHEAFTKELYGSHGTLANLQSLMQSPIPHNLCPNRAEEVYNLCANYPKKPDCSESQNS